MRTLHLIDVENLAGTGRPTHLEAQVALVRYTARSRWREGDLGSVGMNPFGAGRLLSLFAADDRFRLLVGHGPNGADRALIGDALRHARPERFDRVVIGSGDGIFWNLARWFERAGLRVEVVLGRGAPSHLLAPWVVPDDDGDPPAVAARAA